MEKRWINQSIQRTARLARLYGFILSGPSRPHLGPCRHHNMNMMMTAEWCWALNRMMSLFTRMNWSWRWSRAPPCWAVSKNKPAGWRSTNWAQTSWKIRQRWSGEDLLHLSVCCILTFSELVGITLPFQAAGPAGWNRERLWAVLVQTPAETGAVPAATTLWTGL